MSAIEDGQRLTVTYTATNGDGEPSTVTGEITNADYGKFKDVIEFTAEHTDNTWKLECEEYGASLYCEHFTHGWQRVDVADEPVVTQLEIDS